MNYERPEWRALLLAERKELLPTIEGLRTGARMQHHPDILVALAGTDLTYVRKRSKRYSTLYIGSEATLGTFFSQFNKPFSDAEQIRWEGELYGYPRCCIDSLVNRSNDDRPRERLPPDVARNLYGDWTLFKPDGFTPCSYACTNAQQVYTQWQKLIEVCDPQLAESILKQ